MSSLSRLNRGSKIAPFERLKLTSFRTAMLTSARGDSVSLPLRSYHGSWSRTMLSMLAGDLFEVMTIRAIRQHRPRARLALVRPIDSSVT